MKTLNNREIQSISAGIADIALNFIAGYMQWNFAGVTACNTMLSLGLFAGTKLGRVMGVTGIIGGIITNSAFYGLGYGISSLTTHASENSNELEVRKDS